MRTGPTPLLDAAATDQLRSALRSFTVDAVNELVGPVGRAAWVRGDLAGVRRELRVTSKLVTLIRLFLLGEDVPERDAAGALDPLPLDCARTAGLIEVSAGSVRGLVDLRPYAEAAASDQSWWVVSDFGADVRPGPLNPDHVLGIGAASLTLAQATVRDPVSRALDVGTGCGVQALHLGRHAGSVVATDISARALRLAATTAALSGERWDLRGGSLLEPVVGELFDLVVANPPFVVSPGLTAGAGGYTYRDSGLAGDGISRALIEQLPGVLAPGGTAQLLANWVVGSGQSWSERLEGWLAGRGCDAWIWQRELADPGEYVAMWLRDAGAMPGTPSWHRRYDDWLSWFEANGVAAVGMGLVTLWRTDGAEPQIVCEDVPQAIEQPAGATIARWITQRRWLATLVPDDLLSLTLRCAEGVVLAEQSVRSEQGWSVALRQLSQSQGMRWELEVDVAVAALLAACDGRTPVRVPISLLAASLGSPTDAVATALDPVLRDLITRGFLEAQAPAADHPL